MSEEQSAKVRSSAEVEGKEREEPAPLRGDEVPARAGSLLDELESEQVIPSFLQDDIPARGGERREEGKE
jgi:hypothetical protein